MKALSMVTFVALVVAANWMTAKFGMVLGLVTAGTFAAGLTLLVRDWVHETAGKWWVFACIAAGAGLSVVMSSARLALASGVAFAVSELADFAVYAPLRRRTLAGSMALSNTVGAVVDSLLFLSLAGFGLSGWHTQAAVKVAVTVPFIVGVVVSRAVLRHRLRTEGA